MVKILKFGRVVPYGHSLTFGHGVPYAQKTKIWTGNSIWLKVP